MGRCGASVLDATLQEHSTGVGVQQVCWVLVFYHGVACPYIVAFRSPEYTNTKHAHTNIRDAHAMMMQHESHARTKTAAGNDGGTAGRGTRLGKALLLVLVLSQLLLLAVVERGGGQEAGALYSWPRVVSHVRQTGLY